MDLPSPIILLGIYDGILRKRSGKGRASNANLRHAEHGLPGSLMPLRTTATANTIIEPVWHIFIYTIFRQVMTNVYGNNL